MLYRNYVGASIISIFRLSPNGRSWHEVKWCAIENGSWDIFKSKVFPTRGWAIFRYFRVSLLCMNYKSSACNQEIEIIFVVLLKTCKLWFQTQTATCYLISVKTFAFLRGLDKFPQAEITWQSRENIVDSIGKQNKQRNSRKIKTNCWAGVGWGASTAPS